MADTLEVTQNPNLESQPEDTKNPGFQDSRKQYDVSEYAKKLRATYPKNTAMLKADDKTLVDAWIKKNPKASQYVKGYGQPQAQKEQSKTTDNASVRASTWKDDLRDTIDKGLVALPTAGATLGGASMGSIAAPTGPGAVIAGGIGAGVGGAVGKTTQILGEKLLFGKGYGPVGFGGYVKDIGGEALLDALLDAGGRFGGDGLLKLASKIPHVEIKDGIPLLPSQISGSKTGKFVEDMLSNVWPSTKVMSEFSTIQGEKITARAAEIADTIGKFKGSREELGNMIQKVVESQRQLAYKNIDPKLTADQRAVIVKFINEKFDNGFLGGIMKAGNPAELSALFTARGVHQYSDTQVREVINYLAEERKPILDYTRGQIFSDTIDRVMRGTTDPVSRKAIKFDENLSGNVLKKELDSIGDSRLKAIFNGQELKNVYNFADTIQRVGGPSQGWIGRFKNFIYITSLITGKILPGIRQANIFYIASKIMTNPRGAEAYANIIRGGVYAAPKVTKLGYDELRAITEAETRNFQRERDAAVAQYNKEHGIKSNTGDSK